jgi:hypothetical protein
MDQESSRWDEIKEIWESYPALYLIAGFILGLVFFPAIQSINSDYVAFLSNLAPEAVGILVTVFLIDRLYSIRDEARQLRELKERLVREAGSSSNETAKKATDELRDKDWLTGPDGLLKGKHFEGANLRGANLKWANLENATFYEVNLVEADLTGAKMAYTHMYSTSLRNANLTETDLSGSVYEGGCDFTGAYMEHTSMGNSVMRGGIEFKGAYMSWVYLRGADMVGADLRGARFSGKHLDETTTLPDGTNWKRKTDMSRFGCIVEE